MILVTSTEYAVTSRLPALPDAVILDWLEAETGADFALSAYDELPVRKPAHLEEHLQRGACVLVQRKSGLDLVHSLGDVLDDVQARMCAAAPRAAQRVLLVTGAWNVDGDGYATLDGYAIPGRVTYAAVLGAMEKWGARGGTVTQIPRDALIPGWAQLKLKHLREFVRTPEKVAYPPTEAYPDDPPAPGDALQLLRRVTDFRRTLVTLPGLGYTLTERIWEWSGGNPLTALNALTDINTLALESKPRGVGTSLIRSVRRYLGIPDKWRSLVDKDENGEAL